jgi:hypothetical protein
MPGALATRAAIARAVRRAVDGVELADMHTHLYPPVFGPLLFWGLDDLLTYHYLVAEVQRQRLLPADRFWALSRKEQAELIWDQLFLQHSPVSEACRGILTVLRALGLDVRRRDLKALRSYFARQKVEQYVDRVFATAGVRYVVMTNNPFDDQERPVWLGPRPADGRFKAALRLDEILMAWPRPVRAMADWGYRVSEELTPAAMAEVRRFLGDWLQRMQAVYMAVSLPPEFTAFDESPCARLVREAVLPAAREHGVPMALMIGVRKLANPALRLAGDSTGKADTAVLERLCREYPENRFLVTYLSRENQHELCVAARKFANLMPFGCWWFVNNPSIVAEITRQRLELLGLSFIPQHSDARVLDQLIYKWAHARQTIASVLAEKYSDLTAGGWALREAEIRRDVADLFGGNFERFLAATPRAAATAA